MRYRLFALVSIACLLAVAVFVIRNAHQSAPSQAAVPIQPQTSTGQVREAVIPNPSAEERSEEAKSRLADQAAADFKSALVAKYGSSVLQR
ncbi:MULTISPECIES: hypothetical protein [unclassified Caballeronia]|uniref:hypothetical protein n=1 Tax=unclassified Caballeronia TaxID=2646786 RepID=UPI002862B32D|nr:MULTISPECIES: hypothetical protein [unclassified Caballeronia]MDR5822836.1 hypothetical protein [Caballeronia sp. LZ043]MDR5880890.1 hypothetical protein [Caballeronia sp. LZ032]